MALEVETRDSSALTDADLDEMASMGASFDIGLLSKAKEDWVLNTTARIDGKLLGFSFSTLERIGGTPCVLLGMLSVKRGTKRDTVLKGLMTEAFHRALMAFPDEDVVIGSRFVAADGLEAFKSLTDIIPRPNHRAVGEERAWVVASPSVSVSTPTTTSSPSSSSPRGSRDTSTTSPPSPRRSTPTWRRSSPRFLPTRAVCSSSTDGP
jgi:hypothetical protein